MYHFKCPNYINIDVQARSVFGFFGCVFDQLKKHETASLFGTFSCTRLNSLQKVQLPSIETPGGSRLIISSGTELSQ